MTRNFQPTWYTNHIRSDYLIPFRRFVCSRSAGWCYKQLQANNNKNKFRYRYITTGTTGHGRADNACCMHACMRTSAYLQIVVVVDVVCTVVIHVASVRCWWPRFYRRFDVALNGTLFGDRPAKPTSVRVCVSVWLCVSFVSSGLRPVCWPQNKLECDANNSNKL